MTGIAYRAHGPEGTAYRNVHLRIHAQRIQDHHTQDLRVTIQAVERGDPIVESPIHVEWMSPLSLADYLSQSIRDGWDIVPDPVPQSR